MNFIVGIICWRSLVCTCVDDQCINNYITNNSTIIQSLYLEILSLVLCINRGIQTRRLKQTKKKSQDKGYLKNTQK